jgi:hypothetical protein
VTGYGYLSMFKPPKPPTLARAAAASKDPYGLAPNNRSGPLGVGTGTGFAAPAPAPKTANYGPAYSSPGAQARAGIGVDGATNTVGPNGPVIQPKPTPTAAAVNSYDLNTDPALQQIESLVGMSNTQANAAALKQRQDLLLAYGDPALAEAVLGSSDPIAQAAGQNPTSTVKQLGQSRDRNLKTLDDQLNDANLSYSGYRVTQEQQAGQDYQNALAQAAGQLNSNLDTVGSNLAAALAGNNGQLVQGIDDAATRAAAAAAAGGTDPGATDPGAGGDGGTPTEPTSSQLQGLTPAQIAALFAASYTRKQQQLNWGGVGV